MPPVRDHLTPGIYGLRGHRGVRKAVDQGRLVFEDIPHRSVDTPVFQRSAKSVLVDKFPRSSSLDSQTEGIEKRSRDQSVGVVRSRDLDEMLAASPGFQQGIRSATETDLGTATPPLDLCRQLFHVLRERPTNLPKPGLLPFAGVTRSSER